MDVKNLQFWEATHTVYEAPNAIVTLFPTADVICTSDNDVGTEYPEDWK